MKSIRQLLRQPLKTLAGILLVALAVSVLCVSFSQTLAAEDTVAKLKETFVTVALPADMGSKDAKDWVHNLTAERDDIFLSMTQHGLASAYIPSMNQDNHTVHMNPSGGMTDNGLSEPDTFVYANAMLEITVTSIDENDYFGGESRYRVQSNMQGSYTMAEHFTFDSEMSFLVQGTVDRVIGLEEGYHDPTGYNISLYVWVNSHEEFDALGIQEGERYLVYGNDYLDLDWMYRNYMVHSGKIMFWEEGVEVPYWKNYQIKEKEVFDREAFLEAYDRNPDADPNDYTRMERYIRALLGDLYTAIEGPESYMFRTVEMTLEAYPHGPISLYVQENEEFVLKEVDYTWLDEQGQEQTITAEEYKSKYSVPTIVHLDGTVEEFLASEAGASWQNALNDIKINKHNFPVIAVDDLHNYADFACGRADISDGRHFTAEELTSGAKVCILSEALAEANGLSVGDTVSTRFLNYDFANPHQTRITVDGFVNPTAYRYYSNIMSMNPEEEYTIVGLYVQDEPWGNVDNNVYSFTPNTIFVPKTAVSGSMDLSDQGMFTTYVLDGDYLRELQFMAVDAGYDGIFYYYDNGYSSLADSLKGYTQAAGEILPLGLLVYGVLMALYLFLFPGRQRKDLTMMDSFGATHFRRVKHILLSCAGILIPGSVLGTLAGIGLWEQVSLALGGYMEAGVEIILDTNRLWLVCGFQALLVTLLALMLGAVMSSRVNYMKRK